MSQIPHYSKARAATAAALVLLICGVAFWWRLGYLGLIDPDEPFYAQSTREMLAANDWVVPRIFGHPQFEKPAFIYWASMASMRALGETEFAARAPAALFATLLALLALAFGVRAFGPRAGLLAAVMLTTCLEFLISARMMLTDMMLAAFVCGSVFSLWMFAQRGPHSDRWFVVACVSSGLAVLTKGPLGLLLPVLGGVGLLLSGLRPVPRRLPPMLLGAALFTVIAAPWYAAMLERFGRGYVDAFFIHENVERFFHAEHPSNNKVYYYLGVLAIGSAPWLPAIPSVLKRVGKAARGDATVRALVIWCLLCLAFFTLAASKLPTYILFLFVPLALLAGRALDSMRGAAPGARWEWWTAAFLGALQAAALLAAPRFGPYGAFALPLSLVAAALLVAALLALMKKGTAWVTASAAAGLLLPILCLGLGGPRIDDILSARGLSARIARTVPPAEAVLVSPILARGITYYARRPVTVLSRSPKPYYTPHPLPIVVGAEGLARVVGDSGSVVCGATARDWGGFSRRLPAEDQAVAETLGDKILARVTAGGLAAGASR